MLQINIALADNTLKRDIIIFHTLKEQVLGVSLEQPWQFSIILERNAWNYIRNSYLRCSLDPGDSGFILRSVEVLMIRLY